MSEGQKALLVIDIQEDYTGTTAKPPFPIQGLSPINWDSKPDNRRSSQEKYRCYIYSISI